MAASWSPSDSRQHAQARVGTVLRQKWRIDRLVGLGGMAAVYAATHRTGHTAAIKVLHTALGSIEEVRRRFTQEPYIANRIAHAGVVRVMDDDVTEDGAPFVVMELLDGETLDELWQRNGGRLSFEEVTWIAGQILDILAAAHAIGVLHRDIKPQNAFVTRRGELKLLDFGVARMPDGSSAMTQMGGVLGSPAFMPPEQARGQWDLVREPTDIWAVGATMFTLLAGRFVHDATTPVEFLLAAQRPARSISTLVPALPPALAHVIDRALAYAPADRWPTARAMAAALVQAQPAWEEPTADLAASSLLQARVGPGGTVFLRDSFPDWSVEPAVSPSGVVLIAPPPGARTEVIELPRPAVVQAVAENTGFWYVSDGARVVGPVSVDLLRRGIEAGKVPEDSVVCHESWSEWRSLAEAMEFLAPEEATARRPGYPPR
jgi:serine/threonine-protein kinase